ncbi:MAG: shikimate kinase [Acidobacteria bacterium]|nr:MAG: shikimate kinase [Acidobacteriota bacterium]
MAVVYLVGFMGAGKTTVGRRLAELLGCDFVDLDERIEARAGEPIRELFRTRGEAEFRRLERTELERASTLGDAVVALGGGAFCSPENAELVRATGASVYLEASAEVLYARCAPDDSRPLFTTREAMQELLERRRPLYETAEFRIDVSRLTVEEAARAIAAALGLQS